MGLRNDQYEELMRIYDRRRFTHLDELNRRTGEINRRFPEILKNRTAYAENAHQRARAGILGDRQKEEALLKEAARLKEERKELLRAAGLTEQDLEMTYTCPDCRDTGFVNGARCHCFTQLAVDLLYDQSRMKGRLEKENFDTLSFEYYSREERNGKRSQYELMQLLVRKLKDYAADFDRKGGSLLFYGPTGTGKTFLTNCIAKELMDSCHSVVYFTAIGLFEEFEKAAFGKNEDDGGELDRVILDSDLLIIDDLGTERANTFTVGKLFYTVNERALRNKSTVISTNLDPNLLADRYTERVASRILSDYEMIRLSGDDIRIAKKYGTR